MPELVVLDRDNPLEPYRSTATRERTLESLADAARAELHTLGESVEGRPIRAAFVKGAGKSAILVCAGIHGPEYIGTEVALGFLERIRSPQLDDLLDRADVWVIPCLNPDGYERTWARGGVGKLSELRQNAHGVDLNRNYPLPAPLAPVLSTLGGWRTGSDDPKNSFFRGTGPLSEPETAALAKLAVEVPFHASVSLHSTMGTLFPPCVGNADTSAKYRALCAAFSQAQGDVRYRHFAAGSLDRFTGEQEDHQHHVHHTWAICVEHYPLWVDTKRFLQSNLFRRFNPPDPRVWVDNDLPGIAAYFRAALDLPPPATEL